MPERILRLTEVTERTGYSRSSIYALIKAGKFPHQIKLGARAVGWREKDIDQWICDRLSQSAASHQKPPG